MEERESTYICIDLKSFYASVECVDRGLDPLTADLVVADPERSATTICLAVSPSLKEKGVANRCRVYEIPPGIEYFMARPRMRRYMEVSARIYAVYLRFFDKADIHAYSIDECFIDVGPYLRLYGGSARSLARSLADAVLAETGIPSAVGIGPNLFLCKLALDVAAKHEPDRIAELTQASFLERMWEHRPLTDVWGIGARIAKRLEDLGIYDLRGIAGADRDLLYREFGVNAEFLIDHAWGLEPCTIADIKAYRPQSSSLNNGQILPRDYSFDEARIVVREMVESCSYELARRGERAQRISLLVRPARTAASARSPFGGAVARSLPVPTRSFALLAEQFDRLYCGTVPRSLRIRGINIAFGELRDERSAPTSLFGEGDDERGDRLSEAVLAVRGAFGKNALIRGMSLREAATGRERNAQVGGHRA